MDLLSGGEIVIRALRDSGVKQVWGYPGGAALHIYDAMFQQEQIEHILVRHEQAAVHAADGYARATGEVGTVLVTSGPGATNTITGIATAYMDSIPLVIISAQVVQEKIGEDAFQETDMIGVSRPVVKHSFLVKKPEDLAATIAKAYHIAKTGRPGPVVVDIPKDVTYPGYKISYSYPEQVDIRSYQPRSKGHPRQIQKAMALIASAKKPIIYAGGGVILGEAHKELTELAHLVQCPVTLTLMGLGAFPGNDPQFLGMLGMHGTVEANLAMHEADLILAVGARFDDRVTNACDKFCPNARIIHIDVDPTSISKTINADVPIVGDCKLVLTEIVRRVKIDLDENNTDERKRTLDSDAIAAWWAQIEQWREQYGIYRQQRYAPSTSEVIKPQDVVKTLCTVTNGDAYVCSDVGQHQMFAAQYYQFNHPRRWINSGGLGTMGFGLPSAMGVKMAAPDADVAVVTGEGSIQMCIQELATCTHYNLPVKIINLNNQALGMVRQWQDMQYAGRHSSSTYGESLPDFCKLAEAYGHVGIKVTRLEDLQPALEQAFAMKDRTVFVDVQVDQSEHVYPMQIQGQAMCDMLISKTETI
ncbi:acetolactate synthase 3 large subunit [Porticoccus sp. W117]|uniref:acetolactate synthase 3 large subunit n=1 Tax=Porticoccus sp. W117 TaxID=3054777 RepID=UPI0025947E54|nr:acetolactate synthase 3 large subunit [Porticoccus sp. W117]MDM3872006.1 acetolactate synthase 3 large subunit [Porticoccus sp. W117]